MRRLSALDAQFLHIEGRTTVGHVGGLILVDSANAPGGTLTVDDVRAVLEPRLHLEPVLRQRLVTVPLGLGLPYWVDDPDFDIEFHLREVALPTPGDDRQLGEQIARIHARPLDRTRPLWELYVVHGIEGGRQAVYGKIHHSAIDGASGADVLNTILDVTPEPRVEAEEDALWDPAPVPSSIELAARGLIESAAQPLEILRTLPRALPHIADIPGAAGVPGVQAMSDLADSAIRAAANTGTGPRVGERRALSAPGTPLNAPITAHRRFAFGSLPLDEVKAVRQAFEMSVNDVVMALAASALRRWLLDHDGLPEVPIVAAVPVSVRAEGSTRGNEISVMLAELATDVGDPRERLEAVRASMSDAKERFDAVPATILQDISAVIPMALSGLAARAAFQLVTLGGPAINVMISNVPGPQLPLYVAGTRVLGVYPASAIADVTGALNITVFSYDGSLDFGLIACRELVPDVWNIVGYLRDALDELLSLVAARRPGAAEPAHPVSSAARASPAERPISTPDAPRAGRRRTAAKKTAAAGKTATARRVAKKTAAPPQSAAQAPRAAPDPEPEPPSPLR